MKKITLTSAKWIVALTLSACGAVGDWDISDAAFSRDLHAEFVAPDGAVREAAGSGNVQNPQEVPPDLRQLKQACLPAARKLKMELGGCPRPLQAENQPRQPQVKPKIPMCLAMAFHQQILSTEEFPECFTRLRDAFQKRAKQKSPKRQ